MCGLKEIPQSMLTDYLLCRGVSVSAASDITELCQTPYRSQDIKHYYVSHSQFFIRLGQATVRIDFPGEIHIAPMGLNNYLTEI